MKITIKIALSSGALAINREGKLDVLPCTGQASGNKRSSIPYLSWHRPHFVLLCLLGLHTNNSTAMNTKAAHCNTPPPATAALPTLRLGYNMRKHSRGSGLNSRNSALFTPREHDRTSSSVLTGNRRLVVVHGAGLGAQPY